MKRTDLIKKLEDGGFVFDRHGSSHDIYVRGNTKETKPSQDTKRLMNDWQKQF